MKARLIIFLLSAAVLCTFTSCHATKGSVELKNALQCEEYIENIYAPCTLVSKDEKSDEHTYQFVDDKCGFTFSVTSSADKTYYEATFLGYDEKTHNDWLDKYCGMIKSSIEGDINRICEEYSCSIKWGDGYADNPVAEIITDRSAEQIVSVVDKIGKMIKTADVYNVFRDNSIECRSDKNEMLAYYFFSDGKAMDNESYTIANYLKSAEKQLGVGCTYLRSEELPMRDIEGSGSLSDELHTVIYFRTDDGRKMFMTDYKIDPKNYYIQEVFPDD